MRVAAVVTAAAAAGVLVTSGAGPAHAEPVRRSLQYSCAFTDLGTAPITMTVQTDIPNSVEAGTGTPRSAVKGSAELTAFFAQLAAIGGVKTIEGSLTATATVTAPDTDIPLKLPMTVPRTPLPASGSFQVPARGTQPSVTFGRPGDAKVTIGDLTMRLVPRNANGAVVGAIDGSCTLTPGQDLTLQSLVVTEPVRPTATASSRTGTGSAGAGAGSGSGTADGSAAGTRPGGGSGRSTAGASGTPNASGTPSSSGTPGAPSASATTPPTPSAPPSAQGAPVVDTPADDATTNPVDDTAGDSGSAAPMMLSIGVLIAGGVAAAVGFGSRFRRHRSDAADGQQVGEITLD